MWVMTGTRRDWIGDKGLIPQTTQSKAEPFELYYFRNT